MTRAPNLPMLASVALFPCGRQILAGFQQRRLGDLIGPGCAGVGRNMAGAGAAGRPARPMEVSMNAGGGLEMVRRGALQRTQMFGLLERICQELDLTETQFRMAEERYLAVGQWLADGEVPLVRGSQIYAQGSFSLGTAVKPLVSSEFDVDLVCFQPELAPSMPPASLKQAIGRRLKANGRYAGILEEKQRCWRINYANEFHLDITPSIANPLCGRGGELVPEKERSQWKPSNPKGYRCWFEDKAQLTPRFTSTETQRQAIRAQVEPLPEPAPFKGILKRSVQLLKRHRDVWFEKREMALAPVSIVITTLTAKSYASAVNTRAYETELDVLLEVLRSLALPIERQTVGGVERYYVWNPTTEGENFAEKWNRDHRLAQAFFSWHAAALADFEVIAATAGNGLDQVSKALGRSLGERPVAKVLAENTEAVSDARTAGRLSIAPGVGLTTGGGPAVVPVRHNTFYGR